MKSYSQYDEQQYILAALEGEPGRFLDIGGYHPTDKSNTRALVELGWSGVIIEPSPGPFINLLRGCVQCGNVPSELFGERHEAGGLKPCVKCGSLESYGMSDRFTLILAGVGMEARLVRFHATDDLVSTSVDAQREVWSKVGGYYGHFLAQLLTLEQIQNQFGGFEFVNFDAEGVSADLFIKAMDLGWRPRCCVVEHDGRTTMIQSKAKDYNVVYTNETNVVMVRK